MSPRPAMGKETPKMNNKERSETLNRLLQTTKKYWLPLILAALFVLVNVIISIIGPTYVESLTNEISDHALSRNIDMNVVGQYVIILACMYVAAAITSYFSSFIIATVTQKYANNLRKSITSKINRMPLAYFDSTQIGDVLSRVTNDVDSMSQSIDTAVPSRHIFCGNIIN